MVPNTFWVTSGDQPQLAGRYTKSEEAVNSWPAWTNGTKAIYSDKNGVWKICGSVEEMECGLGYLKGSSQHAVAAAGSAGGQDLPGFESAWMSSLHGQWARSPDTTVSATPPRVVSIAGCGASVATVARMFAAACRTSTTLADLVRACRRHCSGVGISSIHAPELHGFIDFGPPASPPATPTSHHAFAAAGRGSSSRVVTPDQLDDLSALRTSAKAARARFDLASPSSVGVGVGAGYVVGNPLDLLDSSPEAPAATATGRHGVKTLPAESPTITRTPPLKNYTQQQQQHYSSYPPATATGGRAVSRDPAAATDASPMDVSPLLSVVPSHAGGDVGPGAASPVKSPPYSQGHSPGQGRSGAGAGDGDGGANEHAADGRASPDALHHTRSRQPTAPQGGSSGLAGAVMAARQQQHHDPSPSYLGQGTHGGAPLGHYPGGPSGVSSFGPDSALSFSEDPGLGVGIGGGREPQVTRKIPGVASLPSTATTTVSSEGAAGPHDTANTNPNAWPVGHAAGHRSSPPRRHSAATSSSHQTLGPLGAMHESFGAASSQMQTADQQVRPRAGVNLRSVFAGKMPSSSIGRVLGSKRQRAEEEAAVLRDEDENDGINAQNEMGWVRELMVENDALSDELYTALSSRIVEASRLVQENDMMEEILRSVQRARPGGPESP